MKYREEVFSFVKWEEGCCGEKVKGKWSEGKAFSSMSIKTFFILK